jgi:predicted transposase YbfD/YdcC
MTKITNIHNLPQTLVNLATRDTYSRGNAHISVTELIGSPRIRVLKNARRDEIVTDVSDMLWSLMGRAMHTVVEQGADNEHIAEERLFSTVNGWRLSGGIDLQILGTGTEGQREVALSDYKMTSAWAVMNEKADWERQLNCYAYLVEETRGWTVTGLTINAIIRDWNRHEAERRPDYPQIPFAVLPQTLWTPKARKEYVAERIRLHQETESSFDWGEKVAECTDEERWFRPGKLAVMKEGRVKALKLFETHEREEAEAYAKENKGRVEDRPGEAVRCEKYCEVSAWCDQYKANKP